MDKDQRASKTRPAQPDKAIETETQNRLEMFQSVSALFAAVCCCVSISCCCCWLLGSSWCCWWWWVVVGVSYVVAFSWVTRCCCAMLNLALGGRLPLDDGCFEQRLLKEIHPWVLFSVCFNTLNAPQNIGLLCSKSLLVATIFLASALATRLASIFQQYGSEALNRDHDLEVRSQHPTVAQKDRRIPHGLRPTTHINTSPALWLDFGTESCARKTWREHVMQQEADPEGAFG